MNLLKSEIYTKYFPVKDTFTVFTKEERELLCRWASKFEQDLELKNEMSIRNAHKNGFQFYIIHTMPEYDKGKLLEMISTNQFTDEYLDILNIIIYRHKYNSLLSTFLFPVLKKEKIDEYKS